MAGQPVNPEKIIELLAELKTKTPDYPSEMLDARKAAFMEHVVSISLQGKGPGGESGASSGGGGAGSSGGSGFFGGMSAAQGMLLQATLGVWIIAAMLTAAYAFRNQIIDLLQGNDKANVEVTDAPPALVAPVTTELPPTELPPTEAPPSTLELTEDGIPVEEPINIDSLSEGTTGDTVGDTTGNTKDNPGLHLGETPGAPAAPGQNDSTIPPGQENKPDKPDKQKPINKKP